ncbi:MAG: sialate O-acetylesterase [Lachnospiraceae bacterium]|nr:sialate O-acetylesterase [Lachnospiraceae bacterium]
MKNEVLLMMFMGQSNMAGRGTKDEAPLLLPGAGYEYRAITAPDCLSPLSEPFGVNENNERGVTEPGMKTGSMVTAFANACYLETKIPMVGVSCAKGGSSIGEWLPGTPYYRDAVWRMKSCEKWLIGHGYRIKYRGMVWCQGCTDGDLHTDPEVYRDRTAEFLRSYCRECGIEKCFLIQIGNHRDDKMLYVPIQNAQEALAREEEEIVMVSRQFKTFAERGLMKDEFHYCQEGYNLIGEEAGRVTGKRIFLQCS